MSEENSEGQNEGQSAGAEAFESILYCFTREATNNADIQAIAEALPEGFRILPSEGEGENFRIQRPKPEEESLELEEALQ